MLDTEKGATTALRITACGLRGSDSFKKKVMSLLYSLPLLKLFASVQYYIKIKAIYKLKNESYVLKITLNCQ